MATFRLGINMAGAISAGAYTAGVLDFLTLALDEWTRAKADSEQVPRHDLRLEVFSGASAGGMCAAISAILLQSEFEHISIPNPILPGTLPAGTSNRFYESWVNRIDISELLKTDDLGQADPTINSLLDSTIIETIANYALTPGEQPKARPWVSPDLTLFLTLTNLRGTPYRIVNTAPGSVTESTFYYGDRIRFQTVPPGDPSPAEPHIHAVPLAGPTTDWTLLRTSAMATGAFPVFLAPRILDRCSAEYTPPLWQALNTTSPHRPAPDYPSGFPATFKTLNVDGGVTNNDPYNLSHDFLAAGVGLGGRLDSDANSTDRAVLSIAPFPTIDPWPADYDPAQNSSVFKALPALFGALIAQSRFFGESLEKLLSTTSFSSFLIAPTDDALRKEFAKPENSGKTMPSALQCASLGAFGGFFAKGFRAHDYALGQRNCQKFLMDVFLLPVENPVIASGLPTDLTARQAIIAQFKRTAPQGFTGDWLPIIPLTGAALAEVPPVDRVKLTAAELDAIVTQILTRFKAVISVLLTQVKNPIFRFFLKIGQPFIRLGMKKPITDWLTQQLQDAGSY